MIVDLYDTFISQSKHYLEKQKEYAQKLKDVKKRLGTMYEEVLFSEILAMVKDMKQVNDSTQQKSLMDHHVDCLYEKTRKQSQVFIFDVWLKGYKTKVYRRIQLPFHASMHDLALTTLATFKATTYNYTIFHGNDSYKFRADENNQRVLEADKHYLNTKSLNSDTHLELWLTDCKFVIRFKRVKLMPTVCLGFEGYRILKGEGDYHQFKEDYMYSTSDSFDIENSNETLVSDIWDILVAMGASLELLEEK